MQCSLEALPGCRVLQMLIHLQLERIDVAPSIPSHQAVQLQTWTQLQLMTLSRQHAVCQD